MSKLTKIEIFDQSIPGLADNVRKWFAQGISARNVSALLFERYQVSIPRSGVGHFRSQRWVPEQELLQEKKIAALAALEVAREQEIRASMVSAGPGEAK